MSLSTYYPEMSEAKPAGTQIEAQLSRTGGWILKTPLELKGRGIRFVETMTAETLVPSAQHKAGWYKYTATNLAFKGIAAKYAVSSESLL